MLSQWELQICTVCFYVDGDARQKMCAYCSVCDAWMCENCVPNWGRRGLAMARRMAERMRA